MPRKNASKFIGRQIGDITVIALFDKHQFKCRCICGKETVFERSSIGKKKFLNCGCRYNNELVGKKFHKLTVVSRGPNASDQKRRWNCKCDCGKDVLVKTYNLLKNKTTSCYKCRCQERWVGVNASRWTGIGDLWGNHFAAIRSGAKKRNIRFEVTIEQLWDLFVKQEGRCAITGQKLILGSRKKGLITGSLDRMNSDGHYTIDNVQWIHKTVNRIKWDVPMDTFLVMCHQVAKHNKHKIEKIVQNSQPNLEKLF